MEARGKYDFNATADDELSFRKGDILKILSPQGAWHKAEMNGLEGFVPQNHIEMQTPGWFKENASRNAAEDMLRTKAVGEFVVRGCQSSPGDFSISVKNERDVEHFKVIRDNKGKYFLWSEKFTSLNKLVEFYRSTSISINKELYLNDGSSRRRRPAMSEYEANVIAAARGLINVLTQDAQHQTPTGGSSEHSGQQSHQAQTVQQETTRSLPGFCSKKKGKNRFSPRTISQGKSKMNVKAFSVYVYLVNKGCTSTPSAAEELELSQAGLGKRSIDLTDNMSHDMVNNILIREYPKMEWVEGWLFHKASGGHRRRKLVAVPPDTDGYTGKLIHNVSAAGKTILYIVPLQQDLDLTPLPCDAPEFQKMPKAACHVCKHTIPLHMLELHIEGCVGSQSTEDEDEDWKNESEVQIHSVTNSTVTQPNTEARNVTQDRKKCPICCVYFPSEDIAVHASQCGESDSLDSLKYGSDLHSSFDQESIELQEESAPLAAMSSEDDVLLWLASQVDESIDFKICVNREDLVQRGFMQWQRQKNGSPINKLNVTFIGEAGVDTGALSKEFLTEMMHGIEKRLFEGSGKKGKSPVYSISDLENGFYRTAGEVFSVSLAQGGPAPRFFRNWCYQFLARGDSDSLQLTKDDVDDFECASLIDKVETATDLTELTDEIVSCGYTGLLQLDRKDSIIRAIVLHATMRLTPMLQQIRNGMKVYNLLEVIGMHQTLCSNLFVPKEDDDRPDSDFIMSILAPELSEKGSPKRAKENSIINFFQDFLQDLEEGLDEEQEVGEPLTQEALQTLSEEGSWSLEQQRQSRLSVPTVLQWLTGQGHKPLLPSDLATFKINVAFDHQCNEKMPAHSICFPIVSACTNTVTFPVEHMETYSQFRDILTVAIRMGRDFSRV